jgi:hypothetical protein
VIRDCNAAFELTIVQVWTNVLHEDGAFLHEPTKGGLHP